MKQLTKKDIEDVFHKNMGAYQSAILQVMSDRFDKVDKRIDKLETTLNKLITTIDGLIKKMADHEDEMAIMKAELSQIKSVLKSNFGIEISLQNPQQFAKRK